MGLEFEPPVGRFSQRREQPQPAIRSRREEGRARRAGAARTAAANAAAARRREGGQRDLERGADLGK